jgi:hypothetical protein
MSAPAAQQVREKRRQSDSPSDLGPLPDLGQTIVIPEDANVDDAVKGKAKVKKIVWHYSPKGAAVIVRLPRSPRTHCAICSAPLATAIVSFKLHGTLDVIEQMATLSSRTDLASNACCVPVP